MTFTGRACLDVVMCRFGFLDPDAANDWQRYLSVPGVLVTLDPLAGCVWIGIPRGPAERWIAQLEEVS